MLKVSQELYAKVAEKAKRTKVIQILTKTIQKRKKKIIILQLALQTRLVKMVILTVAAVLLMVVLSFQVF